MKKLILALAFSALLFPHHAHAAVEDGTQISEATIAPLMAWVERATGTDVPRAPRVIASARKLKTSLGLEGVQQARAMAAYIPGQVVLNNVIWDEESIRSTSYLVHELVHHAQLFSTKHYACNKQKEYEAYRLQNQWLAEHGEDPIVSERFIESVASCS